MDYQIIQKVLSWHANGARIMLRRSFNGQGKVKVQAGPFGFFTKRFDVSAETFEAIKRIAVSAR